MFSHRLQLLLDDERHERVLSLAKQRHVSVAAIIREAIDRGLPATARRRAAAAQRMLEAPDMPVPADPAELRAELDELRGRQG